MSSTSGVTCCRCSYVTSASRMLPDGVCDVCVTYSDYTERHRIARAAEAWTRAAVLVAVPVIAARRGIDLEREL